MTTFDAIAANATTLLIGAVTGGLLGAVVTGLVWWFDRRTQTAQNLLVESLHVYSLREAWILEGPDHQILKLSETRGTVNMEYTVGGLWLRQVEVRAAFDEAQWNSPENQFYNIIQGRRAWIVRDTIVNLAPSYPTWTGGVPSHPAILSSQAMDEICGWIERVALAKKSKKLSAYGCRILKTSLSPVAAEDRVRIFGGRLSNEAQKFLTWYRNKYMTVS